jgi:uncharacterized membrane protein
MAGNVASTSCRRSGVRRRRRARRTRRQALSDHAKLRSIHNNYMTFPVVVLMLSSHFPGLYSGPYAWLALGVLTVGGAAVRHLLNIRFTYRSWQPALTAVMLMTVAALWALTAPAGVARLATGGPSADARAAAAAVAPPNADAAFAIVVKRCTVCHSASPAIRTWGPSPGGANFDSREQIELWRARIAFRAVETRTMPPANETGLTEEERAVLAAWN